MTTHNAPPLLEVVTQMRRQLQGYIEMQTMLAEIRWHSYREHIRAGFSEEQALALCSKIFPTSGQRD